LLIHGARATLWHAKKKTREKEDGTGPSSQVGPRDRADARAQHCGNRTGEQDGADRLGDLDTKGELLRDGVLHVDNQGSPVKEAASKTIARDGDRSDRRRTRPIAGLAPEVASSIGPRRAKNIMARGPTCPKTRPKIRLQSDLTVRRLDSLLKGESRYDSRGLIWSDPSTPS
jgi:hypothetical protein